MKLKDYDNRDGKKVWLSADEVDGLLSAADSTEQKLALAFGARCGLRASEATAVTPNDVVKTPAGPRVRVWDGKGEKYRETPLPSDLSETIRIYAEMRDASPDTPLVDKSTRTIERWVSRAAERRQAETGDIGWQYLGPHDLRRSWGTVLVQADVEPGLIMEWGGWDNWRTFREHYLGAYSVDAERRQLEKVEWL